MDIGQLRHLLSTRPVNVQENWNNIKFYDVLDGIIDYLEDQERQRMSPEADVSREFPNSLERFHEAIQRAINGDKLGPQPETEEQKIERDQFLNKVETKVKELFNELEEDRIDSVNSERRFINALYLEDGLLDEEGLMKIAPHCDPLVIHAPGECANCDQYADSRQQWRILKHVNFTGHYDEDKTSCPSEYFRTAEDINLWGGNRAK